MGRHGWQGLAWLFGLTSSAASCALQAVPLMWQTDCISPHCRWCASPPPSLPQGVALQAAEGPAKRGLARGDGDEAYRKRGLSNQLWLKAVANSYRVNLPPPPAATPEELGHAPSPAAGSPAAAPRPLSPAAPCSPAAAAHGLGSAAASPAAAAGFASPHAAAGPARAGLAAAATVVTRPGSSGAGASRRSSLAGGSASRASSANVLQLISQQPAVMPDEVGGWGSANPACGSVGLGVQHLVCNTMQLHF